MMNFQKIADSLATIANTSSTLSKEQLLRAYASVEGFKEVLQFIYDPYFTTGIGKRKLDNMSLEVSFSDMDVTEVMTYFRTHTTGTFADASTALDFIYQVEDATWQWAATGLVTKDLQIGVSVTTLNKVFGPGFIPKIGIMRGMLCPNNAKGMYIATEKIDGNRRLIMNKETGVEIYTRSGHRDTGLYEIEEQAKQLPKGYVYDCECIAVGDWANNIDCRQASASILNAHGRRDKVKALCFDMLPQADYDMGIGMLAAIYRKMILANLFNDFDGYRLLSESLSFDKHGVLNRYITNHKLDILVDLPNITALPILGIVHDKNEAVELAKPIWETGGEGIMLVEYMSPYEVNPNPRPTLLKIKATKEYTLKCIGICEGDNKYQGMLGSIEVEYQSPSDHDYYAVKVGSGFPDYLRVDYWRNQQKIIGKMVEIESFGESRNAQGGYSLNCPIFKRIKGEKE